MDGCTQKLIDFIQCVKKYPLLYDTSAVDYHSRTKQERIWNMVAKEVKVEVMACKDKWKNLRSGFCRHLRNQNQIIGSDAKQKKPYYLAEYLDFLIPHQKSRSTIKLIESTNIKFDPTEEDNNNDDDTFGIEYSMEGRDDFHSSHHEDVQQETHEEQIDNHTNHQFMKRSRVEQQQQEEDEEDPIEKYALEYFATKKAKVTESCSDDNDADLYFLKSLLPEIKRMTWQQKNQFKIAVLQDIDRVLKNNC